MFPWDRELCPLGICPLDTGKLAAVYLCPQPWDEQGFGMRHFYRSTANVSHQKCYFIGFMIETEFIRLENIQFGLKHFSYSFIHDKEKQHIIAFKGWNQQNFFLFKND